MINLQAEESLRVQSETLLVEQNSLSLTQDSAKLMRICPPREIEVLKHPPIEELSILSLYKQLPAAILLLMTATWTRVRKMFLEKLETRPGKLNIQIQQYMKPFN